MPKLTLYYWPTPNGHKVTLLLEELEVPFAIEKIDIGAGDQFKPEYLAIAPNNRIPALVDQEPADGQGPISIFESGAILQYLAKKYDRFLPRSARGEAQVMQWLFWQMGGLGPMLGQNHHFSYYAPVKLDYAIERYRNESQRLYRVLEKQLQDRDFICEQSYTIADMACYPWTLYAERQQIDLTQFPNILRWQQTIQARPATARAYQHGAFRKEAPLSEEARKILFGRASV
jgi:GSH-dependent disulfide-bond oxidoreductase